MAHVANSRTAPQVAPVSAHPELVRLTTLGGRGDDEARRLLRRALRDAWPAVRRFGWHIESVCELAADDVHVGYTGKDGTIFVKVRNPEGRDFYTYAFLLSTLLHEFTHLSHLGHGKAFYRRLTDAVGASDAEPFIRRQVRAHVCAELLNAVCDNDAPRAKALLAVLPEAANMQLRLPAGSARGRGVCSQLPLDYAAHHGRVAVTRLLLEARAQVDAMGTGTVTPLVRAAERGNSRTALLLLEAGADARAAAVVGVGSGSGGKQLRGKAAALLAAAAADAAEEPSNTGHNDIAETFVGVDTGRKCGDGAGEIVGVGTAAAWKGLRSFSAAPARARVTSLPALLPVKTGGRTRPCLETSASLKVLEARKGSMLSGSFAL